MADDGYGSDYGSLRAPRFKLQAALANSDTVAVIVDVDDRIRHDSVLLVHTKIGGRSVTEYVLVEEVGPYGAVVTRGWGGSNARSHLAGAEVVYLGQWLRSAHNGIT